MTKQSLSITLEAGGFFLTKQTDKNNMGTFFPTRRFTFQVDSVVPFITANRLAVEAYMLEHGAFLRAYNALYASSTLRRSVRYITSSVPK